MGAGYAEVAAAVRARRRYRRPYRASFVRSARERLRGIQCRAARRRGVWERDGESGGEARTPYISLDGAPTILRLLAPHARQDPDRKGKLEGIFISHRGGRR